MLATFGFTGCGASPVAGGASAAGTDPVVTGAVASEYLVGRDDATMRLAYTVTDSPMGSSHQNASVQIISDCHDQCRFVWIIDVLPDELEGRVAALMDRGLDAIRTTLQAAPAPEMPAE